MAGKQFYKAAEIAPDNALAGDLPAQPRFCLGPDCKRWLAGQTAGATVSAGQGAIA